VAVEKSENNTMRTILIVLAVIVGACCLLSICVIVMLSLAGPAIGDVFSEVVRELGTPVP
jgi:hypothetical protein